MFFSRKKYKLPTFPPGIGDTFRSLCEVLPASKLEDFKQDVVEAVQEKLNEASENRLVSSKILKSLEERALLLIGRYEQLSEKNKALAVGAIRYFAGEEDALPDSDYASGFDDDIAVMNHVLEELGIEDSYL